MATTALQPTTTTSSSSALSLANSGQQSTSKLIDPRQLHYSLVLSKTVCVKPWTIAAKLAGRGFKLFTWDLGKWAVQNKQGNPEAKKIWLANYIKTARVFRDALFLPRESFSIYRDIVTPNEVFADDLPNKSIKDILSIPYTKSINLFDSARHGVCKPFDIYRPTGITELPAESDGSLKAVMASNFLKPGLLAFNVGVPNFATFVTIDKEDGSVQTIKVDAKSISREEMKVHPSNGVMQSGFFFILLNAPQEAIDRYNEAAQKLQGSAHITCVNTNCRVLKEAGFSIERKDLDKVVFPTTMMQHLLFRNFIYTDKEDKKHKINFAIVNTTQETLEEFYDRVDLAVVSTRIRHNERDADTPENRKVRGAAAKALRAEEKRRLAEEALNQQPLPLNLTKRKITVSVPSTFGNFIAKIWRRHIFFGVGFSDKMNEIEKAFEDLPELAPFPTCSSWDTKIKKYVLFSKPMVSLIRKHMIGRADVLELYTYDLFNHLKATDGALLNYVFLTDKVVLTLVHANGERKDFLSVFSDWFSSKHALAANLQKVRASGEMRYNKEKDCIEMNWNSGTYKPTREHIERAVNLANQIFETHIYGIKFEVAETATF